MIPFIAPTVRRGDVVWPVGLRGANEVFDRYKQVRNCIGDTRWSWWVGWPQRTGQHIADFIQDFARALR